MTAARLAPLLLSALCLSACANRPSQDAIGRYATTTSDGGNGPALASLPAGAGRVVATRRVLHANGVSQQIVLEGPRTMAGENRITVEAMTTAETGGRAARGEELKLGPPSRADVVADMEREIPGMAMSIAAVPERNGQGPFGYATGSSGRLSCVFAWQYLAPNRPVSLLEGATDTGVLPVSVRVRLCRERPVAVLIEDLRGLTVTRPDSRVEMVVAPTGDALDAAVGPLASAPGEEDFVTTLAPAASQPHSRLRRAGPVAPAARHHATLHRRFSPRGAERHRPARAEHDRDVAAMPRLLLPGDVVAAGPSSPRPSVGTPHPGPAVTAADDSLPLPR